MRRMRDTAQSENRPVAEFIRRTPLPRPPERTNPIHHQRRINGAIPHLRHLTPPRRTKHENRTVHTGGATPAKARPAKTKRSPPDNRHG